MRASDSLCRVAAALALAGLAAALWLPEAARAHALVGKQDLPISEWLFAWAAAVVLIVSFVGLSAAWREPRLEGDRWRPLPRGRVADPARGSGPGCRRHGDA